MLKRLFKTIADGWLILGVTLILLLLLDTALNSWLPENHQWQRLMPEVSAPDRETMSFFEDASWSEQYFQEHRKAKSNHWESYVYWRRDPFEGQMINIDEQGMRRNWKAQKTAQFRIWIFGGSTVWGTGARDDFTLPSVLAKLLDEQGMVAEVSNFGESGYVSTQSLATLLQALQTRQTPDLVIFYEGVNDVFSAFQSGEAGLPQNETHRQKDFRVTDGMNRYLAGFPKVLEGVQRLATSGSRPDVPEVELLSRQIASVYYNNLKYIAAIGEHQGFAVLGYWQPSVFSKQQLSDEETQIYHASWVRHRDLQLAADLAVNHLFQVEDNFRDLSPILNAQARSLFMDFCHLSELGNQYVAEAMLDQVLAVLRSKD